MAFTSSITLGFGLVLKRSERIKSGALLLAGAPSVFKEKSMKTSLVPRVHVALSGGTGPMSLTKTIAASGNQIA